jgi:hypothetical protein
VGPRAISDSASAFHNRKKRLFPERPFLTLDFLPPTEEGKRDKVGSLGAIPVPSQESAVIEDLLYCFIGKGLVTPAI